MSRIQSEITCPTTSRENPKLFEQLQAAGANTDII